MCFFSDFYTKAKLNKAHIVSFITLIPKVASPQLLSEYRPICSMGSLYKILSKVLVARLKGVIGKMVSVKQSTFIHKRNIMDGILMVNEVINLAKREHISCLVMKVDYEKAYDSVSLNYLRYLMTRMGFGDKWIKWLEASMFVSYVEVIMKGSTTDDFTAERGLRQGGPISPFLFVLVMEGMTRLMEKAVDMGNYRVLAMEIKTLWVSYNSPMIPSFLGKEGKKTYGI